MNFLEIALIVLGIILFVAGFVIPEQAKPSAKEERVIADEVIKESAVAFFSRPNSILQENIDESVLSASNKLEREMEKISNEKLFSISEYSETVLKDINKNHSEVMFLYDMLSDKQKILKDLSVQIDLRLKDINKSLAAMDNTEHEKKAEAQPAANRQEVEISVGGVEKTDQKNRNESILALHHEGFNNVEIARRLGMGVGEVKLVVDLYSV